MKKILIALAMTTLTYCSVEAQTKKATEKCSTSADGKTVTCCKTTANPAYKGTAVVAKKETMNKTTTQTSRYQVCKEHGGSYTCCQYKKTTKVTKKVPVTTPAETPVAQAVK
ncbi:hypothetical protein [Flavipsychrobacter stenotrophus]|nr:hypothetical protein [Flavipsychrobacter stenotrophus]